MRTLLLSVVLFASATAANACFMFAGQEYCATGSGVEPCRSTACLVPDYRDKLPTPGIKVIDPKITSVVAPTDAAGKPTKFVNDCSPYGGCVVREAPFVTVETPPPQLPQVYWYQPAPVAVPTVIRWGPMLGYGPWGLPSGPPLRRR